MNKHQNPKPHIPKVIPRGIYLLPSLFTLANIFCGFYSIIIVINHYRSPMSEFFDRAAMLIFLAAVMDMLDGRIARLTHSSSAFGAQLDSLADVISFGIAPGILAYSWALEDFHRSGWIPAFLFLGCGSIRLARFNVLEEDEEFKSSHYSMRYFVGLPIPAAAVCIASMVLLKPEIEPKSLLSYVVLFAIYGISLLMVSRFRYRSFKDVDWKEKRPLGTLFFIVIMLIVFLHEPALMAFFLVFTYVSSGVIGYFLPAASLEFFRRLDQIFLGVKILDDDEHVTSAKGKEDAVNRTAQELSEGIAETRESSDE